MWVLRSFIAALGLGLAPPVVACDLALILAVDISGSVNKEEFKIQMQGLSAGLRDGVVAEALVRGGANIMLVQWAGSSRQEISVPWTEVASFDALDELAARIDATPRAWRDYSTAIGDALEFSLEQFDAAASCKRRVIDVSGDGINNEGTEPRNVHAALQAGGVTVNALVIEGTSQNSTGYFWENVITGEGAFVVTANNFSEYPEKMRQKLTRETARQISSLSGFGPVPAGFQLSVQAHEVLREGPVTLNRQSAKLTKF
jgi:Ca-activated chloride channel family protein